MQYQLARDIRSYMRPAHIYGLAGEMVTLISEHGNVLIVEGPKGRFSVTHSDLTDISAIPPALPAVPISEIPVIKPSRGRQKKSAAPRLKNLFNE